MVWYEPLTGRRTLARRDLCICFGRGRDCPLCESVSVVLDRDTQTYAHKSLEIEYSCKTNIGIDAVESMKVLARPGRGSVRVIRLSGPEKKINCHLFEAEDALLRFSREQPEAGRVPETSIGSSHWRLLLVG